MIYNNTVKDLGSGPLRLLPWRRRRGRRRAEKVAEEQESRRAGEQGSRGAGVTWRKRRYEAAFVSKLNDAASKAAETQTWIRFAVECGYLSRELEQELYQTYDYIIGKLVNMIVNPMPWILRRNDR